MKSRQLVAVATASLLTAILTGCQANVVPPELARPFTPEDALPPLSYSEEIAEIPRENSRLLGTDSRENTWYIAQAAPNEQVCLIAVPAAETLVATCSTGPMLNISSEMYDFDATYRFDGKLPQGDGETFGTTLFVAPAPAAVPVGEQP